MGELSNSGKGTSGNVYSLELCGGTHVKRTGDIGTFVLTGESASSAGVRRIEALTGDVAMAELRRRDALLGEIEGLMKTSEADVLSRLQAILDERKTLANEVAQLRRELAMGGGASGGPEVSEINGMKFVPQVVSGVTGKDLPGIVDELKEKVGSGVILVVADAGGKAAVAAGVTKDLTDKVSAVDLVKAAAQALGGKGGGGRPDMAQAGGADPSKADEAVAAVKSFLEGL
ncbi:DHHA1 domain-containing protein, partial [Brevundimonas sp.]